VADQELPDITPQEQPTQRGRVLVVDDQESIRTQLRWGLSDRFEVTLSGTPEEALQAIGSATFDAVTLDLGLPPDPDGSREGLRVLERLLARDPALKVVVLTGNAERQNAVRAVQLGAYDYYLKPVDLAELGLILERACRLSRLDRETLGTPPADETAPPGDIIAQSEALRRIFSTVRRVARTDVTVLISGESGTGKEVVARAIHDQSPRRHRPFVAINCGAIPDTLVESELFGHEKGAFTGAHAQRKGRLEMAEGGTVFLDEIGDLPLLTQVKLLRVLQDRQLERVGGREVISLDVRILAATNRDILRAMREGKFREDLYYRLAVVPIEIPPLRERPEDLRALAAAFLARFSAEYVLRTRPFASGAMEAMLAYAWPGNIRELENHIKRAVIMAQGRSIGVSDLGLESETAAAAPQLSLKAVRNEAERRLLIEALQRTRGNVSQAAKLAGLSRPAFHELLAKHEIQANDFRSG
jgi:two-component system NtrC family response regulator